MIERFNGRISEVLTTTRFDSAESLAQTIERSVQVYDQHISQKALGHIAPIQALKDWHQKRPERFKKRVYNLRGLDIYAVNLGVMLILFWPGVEFLRHSFVSHASSTSARTAA